MTSLLYGGQDMMPFKYSTDYLPPVVKTGTVQLT